MNVEINNIEFDMKKYIGFIFGPNGAGKGTLAKKLIEKKGYIHINNGEIIREWAAKNNRKDLLKLIDEGEFIDDLLVEKILTLKFNEIGHNHKLLIEGFPRKSYQVKILKKLSQKYNFVPAWIIILHAPLEVLIDRLKYRVIAPDGLVYNLAFDPPPMHFKMSKLQTRSDDKPEIVRKRYEYYIVHSLECISDDYFLDSKIKTINATQTITEVFKEAIEFVNEVESTLKVK